MLQSKLTPIVIVLSSMDIIVIHSPIFVMIFCDQSSLFSFFFTLVFLLFLCLQLCPLAPDFGKKYAPIKILLPGHEQTREEGEAVSDGDSETEEETLQYAHDGGWQTQNSYSQKFLPGKKPHHGSSTKTTSHSTTKSQSNSSQKGKKKKNTPTKTQKDHSQDYDYQVPTRPLPATHSLETPATTTTTNNNNTEEGGGGGTTRLPLSSSFSVVLGESSSQQQNSYTPFSTSREGVYSVNEGRT